MELRKSREFAEHLMSRENSVCAVWADQRSAIPVCRRSIPIPIPPEGQGQYPIPIPILQSA